ncbi:hypothetical protein C8Q70DRAFT_1121371 [Cubamyces menziesii]|nr:hypothetical protein C8Q70DRAFT_1121371 [Cubamyces menziesii]
MSANHVFRCEELATEIFSHLAPGPLRITDTPQYRHHRTQRKTALARAARVCRAWEVPALKVLWTVVDDISELLLVLPCMAIEDDVCVLVRDITPAEWERFKLYTYSVRELHWREPQTDPKSRYQVDPGTSSISPTVWLILSKWCKGRPLCPRLQYLAPLLISAFDPGPVILASPTIRHLEISTDIDRDHVSEDVAVQSLCSHLEPIFASLESLTVDSRIALDGSTGSLVHPSSGATLLHLTGLPALQHLHVASIHMPLSSRLVHIWEIIDLRSLTLTIDELDEGLFPPGNPDSPLRNTLRNLCVKGNPYDIAKLVEYAAGPALEVLDVQFNNIEHTPTEDIFACFNRIAEYISPHVHHISLHLCCDQDLLNEEIAARRFLRPLLPKAHLTHITIIYENAFGSLSYRDFAKIVNAWPNLSVFRIEDTRSFFLQDDGVQLAPRIADLARFAQNHPGLRHLVIPVLNHHLLPPPRKFPKLVHELEIFRICTLSKHASYESLFDMALLLDRLFPNLDVCEATRDWTPAKDPGWVNVERALLALQRGREGAHRS